MPRPVARAPRTGHRRTPPASGRACSRWAAIARAFREHGIAPPCTARRRPCASSARRHGRCRAHLRACRPGRSGTPRSAGRAGRRRSADRLVSWPWPFDCVPSSSATRAVGVEADLGAFVRARRARFRGSRRRRARAAGRALRAARAARRSRAIGARRRRRRDWRRSGRNRSSCRAPLRYGKSADHVAPAQLDRIDAERRAATSISRSIR